jgi:isopenicillin N synthase-like dioxygenase
MGRSALRAFDNDGFLVVPIPDSAGSAINDVTDFAPSFFELPMEEKERSGLSSNAGYRPQGIEYSSSPDHPDVMETFTAKFRTVAEAAHLPTARARALHELMVAVLAALEPLAEQLATELADALTAIPSPDRFRGGFHDWTALQLNYARPKHSDGEFINDLHEDGHFLTLAYSNAPGLELRRPGGEFVEVTTTVREMVVMPGEIAWLLSGGRIRPLYHRVRRRLECQERMAIVFFGELEPNLCAPWVLTDVNRDVDIGARIRATPTRFGLKDLNVE